MAGKFTYIVGVLRNCDAAYIIIDHIHICFSGVLSCRAPRLIFQTISQKSDVHDGVHQVLRYVQFSLFIEQKSVSLERCNPWPHVANGHITLSQLLSLLRHSHCDVIGYQAGHAQRYGRTDVTYLTAINI